MSGEPLAIEHDGPCAIITMNRPEALNALSGAMRRGLVETLAQFDRRDDTRVVILTGAGRAFTAGLDLKELAASGKDVSANVDAENVVAAIEKFSKPLIAAVNGVAITGGFEITLACDVVLASESAVFIDTHVKVGLTPGWGLSQRLSRVVGLHRAKELSLSARPLPASEAERWGLVNHVLPPDELLPRALELGRAFAQWPPEAVAAMKAIIDKGHALPFGEAVRMEAETASRRNASVKMTTAVLGSRG